MNGYSVTEAASVLGVTTERVWELLARGILAGEPDGDEGMRVILKATSPTVRSDSLPGADAAAASMEPQRESSPFRELLTEFRNLTERYGQALLALGESRGEVASLRSRVDLLEARMDLRLPFGGGAEEWPARARRPTDTAARTPGEPASATADEEDDDAERRARRRRHRRATEAFAEAMGRAEDPTAPELPDATEAAAALAALREVERAVPPASRATASTPPAATAAAPGREAATSDGPAAEVPVVSPDIHEAPARTGTPTETPVGDGAEPARSGEAPAAIGSTEAPRVAPIVEAAVNGSTELESDAVSPAAAVAPSIDLVLPPLPEPSEVSLPRELPVAEAVPIADELAVPPPDGAAPAEDLAPPVPAAATAPANTEPEALEPRPAMDVEILDASDTVVAMEPPPIAPVDAIPEADVTPATPVDTTGEPKVTLVAPTDDARAVVDEAPPPVTAGEATEKRPEDTAPPEASVEPTRVDGTVAASATGAVEATLEPVVNSGSGPRVAAAPAEPSTVAAEREPIDWDPERYTVEIADPDWFAGEDPIPAGPVEITGAGPAPAPYLHEATSADGGPSGVPPVDAAVDDGGSAAVAEPSQPEPSVPEPVVEPTPAPRAPVPPASPDALAAAGAARPTPPSTRGPVPAAPTTNEEEVLWYGRRPEPDGADEMEVVGQGRRPDQLPGGDDLEDALAALDALRRRANAPPEPARSIGWSTTDAPPDAPPAPTPADEASAAAGPPMPTPASRAYRRLRRIFPG